MTRQDAMVTTLQLQCCWLNGIKYTGAWTVYVSSLNCMSSEVLRLAFGLELFPSEAVDTLAPIPRVHRAAQQMSAMGLWRPPIGPGVPGSMPVP